MKHILITIAALLLVGCGFSLTDFKDSKLRSAIKEGSIENVKKAIANGANVNAKGYRSYGSLVKPPLHYAAQYGHMEIVQLLISKGANVEAKTDDGKTLLHIAAAKEDKEISELLIAKGADVNAKDNKGRTPLHWATGTGWQGGYEIAKLLISKGADVNVNSKGDVNGATPLHNAAREGRSETIKILIDNGADVNAKNVGGWTPLDMATSTDARYNHPESGDLLRKHGGKHSSIHEAAAVGDAEGVKEFLAAGTDVNATDESGKTPLDLAIQVKDTETATLLRKHGGKTGEELKAEEE